MLSSCTKSVKVNGIVSREDSQMLIKFDFEHDFMGFKKTYGPNVYNAENLYDYVDGGAEKYLKAGFSRVMTFELTDAVQDSRKMIVDVFDMKNGLNSNAFLEAEKEGKEIRVENEKGFLTGNTVQFSKNKYYVKIVSYVSAEPSILTRLAEEISQKIPGR